MNVHGQAALVTGGASGLGEGTARALAPRGAKVAILDLNMDRARTVAEDIGGLAVECDVSSADMAVAAVAAALLSGHQESRAQPRGRAPGLR